MTLAHTIKRNVASAAIGLAMLATVNGIAKAEPAAPSPCKGLEEAACTGNTQCNWRAALIKGETMTKAGEPAKVNRKAHCAKKPERQAKQN